MSISTHKVVEPTPQTFKRYGEPESFESALLTWHGDILELTLTTGEKMAGICEISGDLRTIYVDGVWRLNAVSRDYKLQDIGKVRAVRVANIIAVEHLVDQSDPVLEV